MTNDSKEPFTVQAGKRYNRRDGKVSGVLGPHQHEELLFDKTCAASYYHDGQNYIGIRDNDLISEYIEPTAEERALKDAAMLGTGFYKVMPDGSQEYLRPENVYLDIKKSVTAEPQDEWGPWIGWNGGECPVDVEDKIQCVWQTHQGRNRGIYTADNVNWYRNDIDYGQDCPVAYRIKKEPEVVKTSVWLDENYEWWLTPDSSGTHGDYSEAIITLTDGEPSIRWADIDDT